MIEAIEIKLGGLAWKVRRGRLGTFLRLLKAKRLIQNASKKGDSGSIADGLFEYFQTAIPKLNRGQFNSAPWYEIIQAYIRIGELNKIKKVDQYALFSIGDPSPKSPVAWDHDERTVILWIHIIAYAYKWSKQEIENLWPEEAIGYIQEILAEDQMRQEFEYSLSEIAYPYDSATKKQKYKPLMRPLWMVGSKRPKLYRVEKKLLPIGNVIYPPGEDRFDTGEGVH